MLTTAESRTTQISINSQFINIRKLIFDEPEETTASLVMSSAQSADFVVS